MSIHYADRCVEVATRFRQNKILGRVVTVRARTVSMPTRLHSKSPGMPADRDHIRVFVFDSHATGVVGATTARSAIMNGLASIEFRKENLAVTAPSLGGSVFS